MSVECSKCCDFDANFDNKRDCRNNPFDFGVCSVCCAIICSGCSRSSDRSTINNFIRPLNLSLSPLVEVFPRLFKLKRESLRLCCDCDEKIPVHKSLQLSNLIKFYNVRKNQVVDIPAKIEDWGVEIDRLEGKIVELKEQINEAEESKNEIEEEICGFPDINGLEHDLQVIKAEESRRGLEELLVQQEIEAFEPSQ